MIMNAIGGYDDDPPLPCVILIHRPRHYTELVARMYLDVIRIVLPVSWDRSEL
jgi:hypothetical protein